MGQKHLIIGIIGTIILSTIDTLIPFFTYETPFKTNYYGKNMGWCWIKNIHVYQRYFLFFIPLWILIPINILIFIKIKRSLKNTFVIDEDESSKQKLRKKLSLYPLLLVLCYAPYTIKGLIEITVITDPDNFIFGFTIVSGILRAMHGFLNSIIYGITSSVKKRVLEAFKNRISLIPIEKDYENIE
jgi:hypothetical protein